MDYTKALFYSMAGFAFISFITLAGGNILLGIANLVFFIYLYKERPNLYISYDVKQFGYVIGFFLLTMLLSAFFSGDLAKGIKTWADLCIWRMMPFLIMILALNEYNKAYNVLLASLLGIGIGFCCVLFQGLNGNLRAPGFFGNPMTFGGYLCVYLPVILVSCFRKNMYFCDRIVSIIFFLLGFFALLFNGTRGSWAALAPVFVIIVIYYILQAKKAFAIFMTILVLIGGLIGTTNNSAYFINRFNSIIKHNDGSTMERYAIWESAYNMFKDNPVLGVGLGQYKDNYQNKYILEKATNKKLTHAHNNVIQMLAENGFVGCAGFLTLVFYIFGSNVRDFIKKRCPYSLIIASSTFALFVQGLTEYNFGNSAVMKSYWLLLGCMMVMKIQSKKNS